MKQILLLLLVLSAATTAFAQVPQSFNYQAIARDADGRPISKGQVTVTASILRNGSEVYSEETDHTTTTTGLFTLRVGEDDSTAFKAIDWSLGGYSLKVIVDGAVKIVTDPVPIVSVPYALLADEAVNERQQLMLNGNQLTITGAGGNTVTLAATSTTYQAGAGIEVTNNTIVNKGDVDPTDDLTKTTDFDGDVTGKYDKLQIKPGVVGSDELANGAVTGTKIAQQGATNGQVLKWNGATWVPDTDQSTVGSGNTATSTPILGDGSAGSPVRLAPGSVSGQVLKWTGTAWTPAADATGTGDNWGSQVVQITGTALSGNGTLGSPLALASQNAANGQVLKWNGSAWVPAPDETGGSVGTIGGDLTGALSDLQIKQGAIGLTDLGSMGATQSGQILKWNNTTKQWELGNDVTVGGTAKGDVSGIFDQTLTVVAIRNNPVDATNPTAGQVLKWNGSAWKPDTDLNGGTGGGNNYAQGTGISITGSAPNFTINNTGDTNENDDVLKTSIAPGDVSGSFGTALSVDKIKGRAVSPTTPSSGQVLKWNATNVAWEPAADLNSGGNNYTPGTGITIGGAPNFAITNTGDLDPTDDLTKNTPFGGDVSGVYSSLQIVPNAVGPIELANDAVTSSKIANNAVGNTEIADGAVTANKLNNMGAMDKQVLKWNGTTSAWVPTNEIWTPDASGIYYQNASNGTVRVNINNSATSKLVEMGPASKIFPSQSTEITTGAIATFDQSLKAKTALWHISGFSNYGAMSVFGPSGAVNYPPVHFYANPLTSGGGDLYISNATGTSTGIRVATGVLNNEGYFRLFNNSGFNVVESGIFQNAGYLVLQNSNQNNILSMGPNVNGDGTGVLEILNATEKSNVSLSHLDGYPNNGYASVRDPNGANRAGMYIESDGKGTIFCDQFFVNGTKNFRMVHPRDTTKEIWYACIEGPEAGAYERGTATLTNGEAWVPFSEHFHEVVNPNTLTVTLTPLSADTDGLAVVEKIATGIRVRELRGGKGNFGFDWEVKGVRKGYEDYQPVRPRQPWPTPDRNNLSKNYSPQAPTQPAPARMPRQ